MDTNDPITQEQPLHSDPEIDAQLRIAQSLRRSEATPTDPAAKQKVWAETVGKVGLTPPRSGSNLVRMTEDRARRNTERQRAEREQRGEPDLRDPAELSQDITRFS